MRTTATAGFQRAAPATLARPEITPAAREQVAGNGSFGRWQPTRVVGQRGSFVLYRARTTDELGPGCYVVKTPRRTVAATLAGAQLQREALVAATVNPPGLISVLATEWDEMRTHLVLPYLEGASLRQLIDRRGGAEPTASPAPILVHTAMCLARQVAAAIAALHEAGWLHGQIRPEHVVVSPQGQATLIDLTQARRLDTAEMKLPGTASANWHYASPEQFGKNGVTTGSDIYALGITLYELLVGQPPFRGSSPGEFAILHRTRRVPDLGSRQIGISPELADLVGRLLAKEPLRRPAAEQLVRWLAELEIDGLARGQ